MKYRCRHSSYSEESRAMTAATGKIRQASSSPSKRCSPWRSRPPGRTIPLYNTAITPASPSSSVAGGVVMDIQTGM